MYVFLMLLWVVLNGRVTPEILLTGLAAVLILAAFMKKITGYTPAKELRILKKIPLFIAYLAVLFSEIVRSGVKVAAVILNKKITVEPALVTFDADLKTDFGRFILANSITLTPGTITVSADKNTFRVHCLSRSFLDCSSDSVFIRWIKRLEA